MSLLPENFRAPFIPKETAWAAADRFREQHWPEGTIPVEVEELLWPAGLRLDYVQSLRQIGDVDALLSGDLTLIHVDTEQYMDERMKNRICFSIAHELGHFVLHADIYKNIHYTNVEEWLEFMERVPEDQYSFIEQHAHEFAGRLLVPLDFLRPRFAEAAQAAQKAGFTAWDTSGDVAREYIAKNIARDFGVSSQVLEKRILREGLWPPAGLT